MNKKKKIIIISVIVIIFIIAGFIGGYFYLKNKKKVQIPVKVIEVLETIEGYGYNLEDRDTELFKEKFLELKSLLKNEEINNEEYAKLLAELFVIDLYTIENKSNKYDVGSLEFIYPEEKEKFQKKVMDSMYKMVEDNRTNTRQQELPVIVNTEITSTEKVEYKKGESKLDGYEIKINLSYEKDLEYDKKVIVTLVEENKKIYVVSILPDEE